MNDYAHKHISMYTVQCVLFYYYYSNCIFIFLGGGQTNGQTSDGLCIVLGEGRYSSLHCFGVHVTTQSNKWMDVQCPRRGQIF